VLDWTRLPPLYQVWIDRGGTFTDCIGVDPSGRVRVVKLLSTDDAPVEAIRELLELRPGDRIPPCDLRMGTTLATNALLERRGEPTALLVPEGFGDLLILDDQTRADLFDLSASRPPPLAHRTLEVPGRLDADGSELVPLDLDAAEVALEALREEVDALAIATLHGHRYPRHELALRDLAFDLGFSHVTCSHEVGAEAGFLARAQTAVLDAYLTPPLRRYLAHLESQLPGSRIRVMRSSGGLVDASSFRGRDAVLSGPAGGVVAAARVARDLELEKVIAFDMGGTSTDVSRYAGTFEERYEARVAGVRIRTPMIAVHTVAAGGGSICRFDGVRLRVGPESAGATPGPLCYGHRDAREVALTDAALVLGRFRGERFPMPLDVARAEAGIDALAKAADLPREACAEGLLDIACAHMAGAISEISVARGHDVRDHALVFFGGAAGQYACRVARALGIRELASHPWGGVLSAYGMGVAPLVWRAERALDRVAPEDPAIAGARTELEAACPWTDASMRDGGTVRSRATVDLRYVGSEVPLTVPLEGDLREAFAARHRARFGYARDAELEATTLRVEVSAELPTPSVEHVAGSGNARGTARLYVDGGWREVPLWHREELPDAVPLEGPLLVLEETGTLVVEPGFVLRSADGILRLVDEHRAPLAKDAADPVFLEVAAAAFTSIAERMGAALRRTALSTNVRDRLDYSCAVFDAQGHLVANAPHIPVHLGAMGATVRALRAAVPMRPGDVYASNDPAAGGSHLPDITVVTPVHVEGALRFFVAARGHHADVGGISPGSMPARSTRLAEEGVVLRDLLLLRGGVFLEEAVRAAFEGARRPSENVADLQAQIAAVQTGARLLVELAEGHGERLERAMEALRDDAARRVGDAIEALPEGTHVHEDAMDDGTPVRVAVTVDGRRLRLDFEGTGATGTNLNAPRAVTRAAILYALRTMVGVPIPLNEGCLRDVEIRLPPGCLLDPPADAAVAGGNVETSQRVVDVILGALGLAAASQGTMNNVALGDGGFGYYETLGGGVGAGPSHSGGAPAHTHMTNSRITDPEILEARHPLRVRCFAVRRGSGGAGRHPGGDGLIRELEARVPLSVTVLSERRERAPFGLEGGAPGARGRNQVLRANGDTEELGGRAEGELGPGDVLRVETPGGGGWGA